MANSLNTSNLSLRPNPERYRLSNANFLDWNGNLECNASQGLNKTGSWVREGEGCRKFEVDQGKSGGPVLSSICFIELNLSTSDTWVLDTGAESHICTNVKVLQGRRDLGKNEVDLRVGNKSRVAATVIGFVELVLPSGLVLVLHNVYFEPNFSRNIVSISLLEKEG